MSVHDSARSIGDMIAINASVGDVLVVETEKEEELHLEVYETPTNVPTEEYHTSEVLCDTDDDSDDIIGLYAQVTDMGEMSADYFVYAVRYIINESSEELGDILSIEVKEE